MPGERGAGPATSGAALCCRMKKESREGVEGFGTVTTEEVSTLGLPWPVGDGKGAASARSQDGVAAMRHSHPRGSRLDGAWRLQYRTLGPGGVLLLPVRRRQALGTAAPRDEGEELGSRLPIDVQVPDRPLLAQHDMAAGQQVPGGRQGCTWGPPVGYTHAREWVVAGDTGPHQTPVLSAAGQTMRLPQIHEHSRERHPRPGPREAGAGQQQVGPPCTGVTGQVT